MIINFKLSNVKHAYISALGHHCRVQSEVQRTSNQKGQCNTAFNVVKLIFEHNNMAKKRAKNSCTLLALNILEN